MIETYQDEQALQEADAGAFSFATVGAVYEDGVTLIFPGETEPTEKRYLASRSCVMVAGDRVKVCKIAGTYVVEYVIGPPLQMVPGVSSLATTATLADLIREWNELISGIDSRGYRWIR